VRSVRIGVILLLLLSPVAPIPAAAQSATPRAEQPRTEFFSGIVTALADDQITVFKTVLGKNSETRAFLITPDTRVEGKLKMKARVTVRYTREEDGDRALHIIVRTSQKK
jgi:hypothetical protein